MNIWGGGEHWGGVNIGRGGGALGRGVNIGVGVTPLAFQNQSGLSPKMHVR